MEEFTDNIRQQAAQALRSMLGQEPTPDIDPILELVAFLLEEGSETSLTADQLLLWNQLGADKQQELIQAINLVMETEKIPLPSSKLSMAVWAEWLVMSTLDRIKME
jgi:hypothetical protein